MLWGSEQYIFDRRGSRISRKRRDTVPWESAGGHGAGDATGLAASRGVGGGIWAAGGVPEDGDGRDIPRDSVRAGATMGEGGIMLGSHNGKGGRLGVD